MDQAFVIRPVSLADLDWFYSVAHLIGVGFTSFPNDREFIKNRVTIVDKSFKEEIPVEERIFLFAREQLGTNEIVGIAGIDVEVGFHESFYNYQVSTVSQTCQSLKIYRTHNVLNAVNNFQHASEMISFWVHPDWRGRAGKYISLGRFLFMAQFPLWFNNTVISEIRGVCDAKGVSPFWEAVGKYFFGMEFAVADALTMTAGKQFIADLLSRDPIYIDLLPEAAQKVIGVEHQESQPARQMLESMGFAYNNHVDIFDAGPLLAASRDKIKIIEQSKVAPIESFADETDGVSALVYNNRLDARMTQTNIKVLPSGRVCICADAAEILQLDIGQQLRYYLM